MEDKTFIAVHDFAMEVLRLPDAPLSERGHAAMLLLAIAISRATVGGIATIVQSILCQGDCKGHLCLEFQPVFQ